MGRISDRLDEGKIREAVRGVIADIKHIDISKYTRTTFPSNGTEEHVGEMIRDMTQRLHRHTYVSITSIVYF